MRAFLFFSSRCQGVRGARKAPVARFITLQVVARLSEQEVGVHTGYLLIAAATSRISTCWGLARPLHFAP
jgi:hypothetical protein